MTYLTAREAAAKWHLSRARLTLLLAQGRVAGAQRLANGAWIIPEDAELVRYPPGRRPKLAPVTGQ
jgi:predicted DNA-binding protein (UPF0251 family)